MSTPKGNSKSLWNAARYGTGSITRVDTKAVSEAQPQNLTPVKSSNIAGIGAHPAGGIIVEFHSGKKFHYPEVPAEEHEKLMAADSIGAHFYKHIRAKYRGILQKAEDGD